MTFLSILDFTVPPPTRSLLTLGSLATLLLAACGGGLEPESFEEEVGEPITQANITPCAPEGCSSALATPPAAPADLRVSRLTSAVRLSWRDVSYNALGFRIERRRAGTTTWYTPQNPISADSYPTGPDGAPLWPSEPNSTSGTTWTDRTAMPGLTYQYRVVAYNWLGSTASNIITVTVPARALVTNLTSSQRSTLASMMNRFLTDAMVTRHAYFRHHSNGTGFFYDHRRYIQEFEDYLVNNGQSALVPLAMWDSGTPIPSELQAVRRLDNGTARAALVDVYPRMPVQSILVPVASCWAYSNLELLGHETMNLWHNPVHSAVGGAMGYVPTASAAYIFLPWHAYVDHVWTRWQTSCRSE